MAEDDLEDDIYTEEGLEDEEDNDEISPREEAFMKGYDEELEEEK